MQSFVALVCCTLIAIEARAELFTATSDLEKLLVTERETIFALQKYIEAEQYRLEKIQRLKIDLESLWKLAERDAGFVYNPVNAFLLVKKLTADFGEAKSLIFNPRSDEVITNLTEEVVFPDNEDLDGAAVALLRLQDTYALDTSRMANGLIAPGANESPRLTADDCFELGRQSYVKEDFYHTVLWMQEALDRLNTTSQENEDAVKVDILDYLAYATFRLGNVRHAVTLNDELLRLQPSHTRANGNKKYYLNHLREQEAAGRGDTKQSPIDSRIKRQENLSEERQTYERLCRGESVPQLFQPPSTRHRLRCRYFDNGHPYMILQPAKLEVVHERPYIVLFHDVLTPAEIRTVIELGDPKLRRATVQNAQSDPHHMVKLAGELEFANYRISKSAWLKNTDHDVVRQLSLRFEYLTGLTHETAEELQVVNYGIGGHYEPHFDFARREETDAFKSLGTGNRIATWINYMSDVKAGGATVFPNLGLTLWPKKGSAAFWWNLYRNGEGDVLTRHAGCPVLAGSKWVSNKWFHERGQEFRRPCGLKPMD
ncbi:prolyl 4-hydroxylase subunit alpha-2-like [Tropilaelaps mercedesae]|uniref:procollagen-proline 4-dioxygenase n=1 Tax=Tropilaelaps mercedesae TaxID=418985 RepID=A0A1V9XSX6_9ACAR|nr:prolyl 4-hydroxylase subunit alpha-2-like [Tropilaelaps mercedesae]